MTTRRYFRSALALPLVVPVIGILTPWRHAFAAIWLGCVPYLPVALLLWIYIGRARSLGALIGASIYAPLLFGVVLSATLLLMGQSTHLVADFLIDALVGALYSSPFVALAWVLWAGARWAHWVDNEFAT